MSNEYALMHIYLKIPSSDDFANILELLYTLKIITEQNYYNLKELDLLNCLACKVFTTVCSSSDLVGSVSSLCVWRCGHLLVLLLSGGTMVPLI